MEKERTETISEIRIYVACLSVGNVFKEIDGLKKGRTYALRIATRMDKTWNKAWWQSDRACPNSLTIIYKYGYLWIYLWISIAFMGIYGYTYGYDTENRYPVDYARYP